MYPQSKSSGYEGVDAQAWPSVQPAPAWPRAAQHAPTGGWQQPQQPHGGPELAWPPPSLRSVPPAYAMPSAMDESLPSMHRYAGTRGWGWKGKLAVVTLACGAGVFARPFLQTHVRELPADALVVAGEMGFSLPAWVALSSLTEIALVSSGEAPVPAPFIITPLPTPRVASMSSPPVAAHAAPALHDSQVRDTVAPAPAPIEAPAAVQEVAQAPVARPATAHTRRAASKSNKHKEVRDTRLAMRTPPQVVKVARRAEPVVEPEAEALPPAPVAVARRQPAPAPDSLDGLMNRAILVVPEPQKPAAARMRFPDEKPTVVSARARSEGTPKMAKPERITSDVTAAATAAARAETASSTTSSNSAAVPMPKLPGKVRLSDDPLAGLNGREIEGKRQTKAKAAVVRR